MGKEDDIPDTTPRGAEKREPDEKLTAFVKRRLNAQIPVEHAKSFGSARNYLAKILNYLPLNRISPSVDALGEPVVAAFHFEGEGENGEIYVYSTGMIIVT